MYADVCVRGAIPQRPSASAVLSEWSSSVPKPTRSARDILLSSVLTRITLPPRIFASIRIRKSERWRVTKLELVSVHLGEGFDLEITYSYTWTPQRYGNKEAEVVSTVLLWNSLITHTTEFVSADGEEFTNKINSEIDRTCSVGVNIFSKRVKILWQTDWSLNASIAWLDRPVKNEHNSL